MQRHKKLSKRGLKAAYVTDDSLAAGLLNGLTDAGISVPADFELISSNDTNYTKGCPADNYFNHSTPL